MRAKPDLIDQWSFYDYKPAMSEFASNRMVPGWIPTEDRRRQLAYMLLSGYVHNNSRAWMPYEIDEEEVNSRREYGDAATLIDSIVSSVLGEEQKILVDGAVDEPVIPSAVDQQILLEQWAEDERLLTKMLEAEHTASELGDAVYVLGWDDKRGRPRLRVYDPGFYFPVLEDDPDEYPKTVHLCWEFDKEIASNPNNTERWLRRITWRMVPVEPIVLPWNYGIEADELCFMSDGEWKLEDIKEGGFYDLDERRAVWNIPEVNTLLDFIPVVHLPNTVAEQEHFGTSSLARIVQILDDLVSTDTDLQASSATTGSPPLAITGTAIPTDDQGRISTYGPGTVLETGDGNATMIDTSGSLKGLLEYDDHLLSRLSINSRVPEALLGRVKPNEVPSGIALTLSFTPHANLVKEMRLVRRQKYTLLLKMVTRMFMNAGVVTEYNPVKLFFGSFLPADKQEASTIVTQLLRPEKPLISLQTAVEMLVRAGFPIEDAQLEIQRILSEDFESANRLLDATGDPNLVYERLNIGAAVGAALSGNLADTVQGIEEEGLPEGAIPPS